MYDQDNENLFVNSWLQRVSDHKRTKQKLPSEGTWRCSINRFSSTNSRRRPLRLAAVSVGNVPREWPRPLTRWQGGRHVRDGGFLVEQALPHKFGNYSGGERN